MKWRGEERNLRIWQNRGIFREGTVVVTLGELSPVRADIESDVSL
jgi:hypothetical protein